MRQQPVIRGPDRPFAESTSPFLRAPLPPTVTPRFTLVAAAPASPPLRREWPQPRITSQFPEIAQSARTNGRQAATAAGSGER